MQKTTSGTIAAVLSVAMAAMAAATGCSKDDPPPGPMPPPGVVPTSTVVAVAPSASGTASTAPPASADPPTASASATATTTTTTTGTAVSITGIASTSAKPAASTPKAAATCGDKPLPPCPLYAWMKANTSAAMSAQDFDALTKALDKVVSFAPPGYGNWASIARDGANAARAQNVDGVKASCRGCHNQYKDKYKKELRDRPI